MQVAQIVVGDAEFVCELFGQVAHAALQLNVIVVLHIVRLLVGFSVEVDDAVPDLERLSGQPHAPLHIVLAAVDRTSADVAEFPSVLREDWRPMV